MSAEWLPAGWDDEPEEQTDIVDVIIAPADLAAVEIGPDGTRKLTVTSGDEKERLEVLMSRTDPAIVSDLLARRDAKPIIWEVDDYTVLSATPTA